MLILLVEIHDVGSGNNENIGLVSGNLKWSSSGFGGYKDGIVGRGQVSNVISAMNIARGGGFGGFQGTVSVSAYSNELVTAVLDKSISLIGKDLVIKIQISEDGSDALYESQRFICPISAYRITNEGLIKIDCDTSKAFDRKRLNLISVTKEMALFQEGSSAIGKTVTESFGQIVDFPMVFIPTDKQFIGMMSQTGIYSDDPAITGDSVLTGIDGTQIDNGFDFPLNTYGTEFSGYDMLHVVGKWQANESSRVWIAVAHAKEKIFGDGAESRIAKIRRELVGRRFKVVRGKGQGSILNIEAVEWNTHPIQLSIDHETVWIQVSTNDIGEIESSGSWDSDDKSNSEQLHPFNLGGFDEDNYKKIFDERFVVASTGEINPILVGSKNTIKNDLTFVSLVGYANVFILSGKCDATAGKIIGSYSDSSNPVEVEIPIESIRIIHKNDKWQMIRVNIGGIVEDDESALSFANMKKSIDSAFRVTGIFGQFYNQILVNPITPIFEDDSVSDGQIISSIPFSHSFSWGTSSAVFTTYFGNVVHIPINGKNISELGNSTFVIPKCKYSTVWNDISGSGWDRSVAAITFHVIVSAFSQSGVCMGQVRSRTVWWFSTCQAGEEQSIEIDPINSVIKFSSHIVGYDATSEEAFSNLKSQLDVSKIIECSDAKKISFIAVQVVCINQGAQPIGYGASSGTASKVFDAPYIGVTNKIDKKNIYLRTARDNGLFNCSTPVGIVRKLAVDSSVPYDSVSFDAVEAIQWNLFSTGIGVDTTSQFTAANGQTYSDCADEICKQSMTAIFQEGDGKIYAKWFADDDGDTPVVYTFTDIAVGSLNIDKPSSGYLSSDYSFSVKKSVIENPEILSVNTDGSVLDFPESTYRPSYGSALTTAGGWLFESVGDVYSSTNVAGYKILRIRKSGISYSLIDSFQIGSMWKIGDGTEPNSLFARVIGVSPDFLTPDGYGGCRVAFQYYQACPVFPWTISSIQSYSPNEMWRDYVSGSFVSDYTTARNIWEHANNARIAIGLESKMPVDYTSLKQPVWGDDSQAIMNWILYTVIHNTREKAVISFRHKMTPETIALKKMDYVKFQFGPYASINGIAQNGVKGWICEIEEDYSRMEFVFTILTSVSDTDALIIDERFADGSTLIDENPVSSTFYDEGRLA